MQFISIVGTQVMAVLNPLLASREKCGDINRVHLLATAKTLTIAERIKSYLIVTSRLFTESDVTVTNIANGLVHDRFGNPPCHLAVRDIPNNDTTLFNLAGGMNFQVAACMAELHGETTHFIYPDQESIHLFNLQNNTLHSSPCPFPETKIDVLALQGVNYKQEDGLIEREKQFADFRSNFGIKKPKGTLSSIRVGTVLFDAVWNTNNVMTFLCLNTPSGTGIDEARELIGTAMDRPLWGELYSRRIIVISANSTFVNRLQRESRGKITAYLINNRPGARGVITDNLLQLFGNGNESAKSNGSMIYQNQPSTGNAPVLITALGKDPVTTLLTLWSHRPQTAYLLYTPKIPEIAALKEAITSQSNLIPIQTIKFIPVSLLANELLNFRLEEKPGRIEVNITPGTKSQCAMLAWWAKKHGAIVYSIDNPARCCRTLTQADENSYPLQGPSPRDLVKLTGHELKSKVAVDWMQERDRNPEKLRITFLNYCVLGKSSLKTLFRGESADEHVQITTSDQNRLTVAWAGSRIEFPRNDNGAWFERLVGESLRQCNADDVHLNIATRWDEVMIKEFQCSSSGKNPHMTEVDAVARFATTYFAVSAKSGKIKSLNEAINEIKGNASLFGRFTIAVLARLFYTAEPVEVNGVWIIGPATFCDTEKMKAFLDMAKKGRRTTEE